MQMRSDPVVVRPNELFVTRKLLSPSQYFFISPHEAGLQIEIDKEATQIRIRRWGSLAEVLPSARDAKIRLVSVCE